MREEHACESAGRGSGGGEAWTARDLERRSMSGGFWD